MPLPTQHLLGTVALMGGQTLHTAPLSGTPRLNLNTMENQEQRVIIYSWATMWPWSESTLEHLMWSWSPEDVGPAENSWQGEVRLSVLQRCGDVVKPGERTQPVTSPVQTTAVQWRKGPPAA